MTVNNGKPNPKALKLEGLENINKKVTIGFKCHPKIKLRLANEAKKVGLTLSEFVETLIQQLDDAVQQERKEVERLKEQIAFYENDILLDLFKECKNEEVKFKNPKGDNIDMLIKAPKDLYTVIINSYKIKR